MNGSATRVAAPARALALLFLTAAAAFAGGGSNGVIGHVKPMNLFDAGSEVTFAIQAGGEADRGFTVSDYRGNPVQAVYDREAGRLRLGRLAPGWYVISNGGRTTSFGVAPFTDRTAAACRDAGRRFGLKVFMLGRPGVWWRRPLTWELDECVTACEKLGLQWTRHAFNGAADPGEPGVLSTLQLVRDHRMNCVMKIEGIPENAYDEKRYGPPDRFRETKNPRGWQRCSVPLREPYQRWLAGEVAKLPPEQNVFEMGNEVWDYMTAGEFAEWCRLAVPVLKNVRPGCSVGADPGDGPWGEAFARAGGFDGMDAMYIHPYSFTPPPEVRVRVWLRNRRERFEELSGRKLAVYVTEYGWPTAPRDRRGHSTDERRQAQRTVRESLMLYAEGCRTLIPHWMADREQDPTEREHWFGFFRLCGEPKPVVIAHAACARMIDGSRFLGDLVLPGAEKGVGAMLFQRPDGWTAAVWTRDEEPGAGRDVTLPVVPAAVYGLMGEPLPVPAESGRVTVKAGGDVTYLVGAGTAPAALTRLVDRSGELSATRWHDRVDGDTPAFTVGAADRPVPLAHGPGTEKPTIAVWHEKEALRIRLRVPAACARNAAGRLFCFFSTRPERQLAMKGCDYFDYELKAVVRDGVFTVTLGNPLFEKRLLKLPADAVTRGIRWRGAVNDGAIDFSVTLPKEILKGFGEGRDGLMSGQVNWVTEGGSWKLNRRNAENEYQWPLWKLEKGG